MLHVKPTIAQAVISVKFLYILARTSSVVVEDGHVGHILDRYAALKCAYQVVGVLRGSQRGARAEQFVELADTSRDLAMHRHVAAHHEATGMDVAGKSRARWRSFDREWQIIGVAELNSAAADDQLLTGRIMTLQVTEIARVNFAIVVDENDNAAPRVLQPEIACGG